VGSTAVVRLAAKPIIDLDVVIPRRSDLPSVVARLGGMGYEHRFQNRRWWVRLYEKGGKRHEMPTHHNLEEYGAAYIGSAGTGKDKHTALFRTVRGKTPQLTERR